MINVAEKEAHDLMDLLIIAAGAKTNEEKARVCWRASDHMWHQFPGSKPLGLCRAFNDLLQDQEWPWVKNLWSDDETEERMKLFSREEP